jgi:ABC-type antimicrobial peptide transport system permease subunit
METLRLLVIVVAIMLALSCANAANLLLLRGVRRRGEMAVRRALGASGGRLLRQHFTEGVMLATMACLVGLGLSFAFRAILRKQSIGGFPVLGEMPIDPRIFLFALALSLFVGIAFS